MHNLRLHTVFGDGEIGEQGVDLLADVAGAGRSGLRLSLSMSCRSWWGPAVVGVVGFYLAGTVA